MQSCDLSEVNVNYIVAFRSAQDPNAGFDPSKLGSHFYGPSTVWRSSLLPVFGPHPRSWAEVRSIFSQGTAGAPGAVRWGSSREEWGEGAAEREEERAALRAAILADASVPPHFRQLNRVSCKLEIQHPLLDTGEVLYHVPTDDEIRCVPLRSA